MIRLGKKAIIIFDFIIDQKVLFLFLLIIMSFVFNIIILCYMIIKSPEWGDIANIHALDCGCYVRDIESGIEDIQSNIDYIKRDIKDIKRQIRYFGLKAVNYGY